MAENDPQGTIAFPEGARVVHIGTHKTGTTALQWALHNARDALAEHDVTYAGKERRPSRAVSAAIGRVPPAGPVPYAEWEKLTGQVRDAAASRVVVSSEWFTDASEDQIPSLIDDLGGSNVHVVVTVRTLARVMPSQWQQEVQAGLRMAYDTWLERMFSKPLYGKPTPMFWWRHRHDRLVERWARVVGPERVTVVVVDESDKSALFRTFESLLELSPNVLESRPEDGNRSLTYGEVELIRELNNQLHDDEAYDRSSARQLRRRVVSRMLAEQPPRHEVRVPTPAWAAEKCGTVGAEIAANLESLGVRVVGDLTQLSTVRTGEHDELPPPTVSTVQASRAVLGVARQPRSVGGAGTPQQGAATPARPASKDQERVADTSAVDLLRVLGGRLRRRLRRGRGRR